MWQWLVLAFVWVVFVVFVFALCVAAKRGDEASERDHAEREENAE